MAQSITSMHPTAPLIREQTSNTRIVLISTVGNVGGMERSQLNLGAELVRRGWDVEVIFPKAEDSPVLSSWCTSANLKVRFVEPTLDINQRRSRGLMSTLRALVKEKSPCIVHINYPSSYISLKDLLAISSVGCPILVSVHGLASWETTSAWKIASTFLAARLCSAITANSYATQSSVQQAGVALSQTRVISCGVPVPTALPDRGVARRRFGIADNAFVVASAGRLVKQKKIDDVIRAVAALPQVPRPVQLLVAGDGPEHQPWKRLALELSAPVRFLGRQEDMNPIYAAADIFVLPSERESFGLVFVEAALQGVASIGVNQGGVPDIIEEGKTGILVPLGDPPALINALAQLQADPERCERMGQAANARAKRLFNIETMADQFIALYQELLDSKC